MPKKGTPTRRAKSMALDGLAEKWEKCQEVRQHILETGSILKWETPTSVGVINFDTMKHNVPCLAVCLEHHLQQDLPALKTLNIFACRREVGVPWC